MSTPDVLPPITARTSSKGSSHSPVSGTAVVMKPRERPALITLAIESPLSSPGMEHRQHTRQKKPSGGSTTSSNKTHSSQGVGYLNKQDRTKTWCPTSSTERIQSSKSDEKLETLFERQTTMVNGNAGQTPLNQNKGLRTDTASQFSKTPSKATNLSRRSVSTQDLSSVNKRDKNNNASSRQSKKTKLQRYNSDQKLTDIGSNRKNSTTHTNSTSQQRRSLGYSSGDRDTYSQSRRTSRRDTVGSTQMDETADDAGYDSDENRQDRIIQWLIGVESSCEEQPPEPTIVDNGPPQTDTAIHVVYEGQKPQQPVDLSQIKTNRK